MTVTLDQLKESARKIVAAAPPGFRYQERGPDGRAVTARCMYVPSSDPRAPYKGLSNHLMAQGAATTGCLVGEILKDLGLLTDRIAGTTTGIESLVLRGFVAGIGDVHSPEGRYLVALQVRQDSAYTWAAALEYAEGQAL